MLDSRKPHHTAEGFRNNYPGPARRGSFWTWQWERWRKGLPKMPEGGFRFDVHKPDVAWLKANRSEATLTWIGQVMHVNPEEAVQIHRDLRARHSVAMHWGTFILTDEPLDEPPHRLAAARRAAGISAEEFFLMRHGETRRLAPLMREDSPRARSLQVLAE